MKTKIFLATVLLLFATLCGLLVWDAASNCESCGSGLICLAATSEAEDAPPAPTPASEPVLTSAVDTGRWDFSRLRATQGENVTRVLGETYPEIERTDYQDKFKIKLELTSRGAAIREVLLSEFDNRDPNNPQVLTLLRPVETPNGQRIYSLANDDFQLQGMQNFPLPLERLDWQAGQVVRDTDGTESVAFTATLRDAKGEQAVRLTKTYRLRPHTYLLECDLDLENLTEIAVTAGMKFQGPAGMRREGFRGDMRNVMAAYQKAEGIETVRKDAGKLRSAVKKNKTEDLKLKVVNSNGFLWAAQNNKYFSAIVRPLEPQQEGLAAKHFEMGPAQYFDPDIHSDQRSTDDDEELSFTLNHRGLSLEPAGQTGATQTLKFQVYLGPKDRDVFANNDLYKTLGFHQTISFLGCCCPQSIISPMALFIMQFMKWLHDFIPNYGIVIMIIVAIVRLILHPITKNSQISMSKVTKVMNSPEAKKIKEKYGKNQMEAHKHLTAYAKDRGVDPMLGPIKSMMPMMLQMPILIALYSAIYANVELRGAPFLPFWITDLSVPDALIAFPAITVPLVGWQIEAFNLLPVVLAGVMILQQRLMPSAAAASTDPQMAQQQKMMMFMMPIMMLLIFYNMPSGLNLYFMSSTAVGVMEQTIIRRHIRQREEQDAKSFVPTTSKMGGKAKKKKPKPFFKNTM